jgi:hypothetical protein
MRPERLEEVLWEREDGTIAPDEQAKLEQYLAEHPESKDLEREISGLAELLVRNDEIAPPKGLRERIDRALTAATPPGHEVRIPRSATARRWKDRWPARMLPVAASLVLGVAIGYLLQPGATGPIDESRAAGTMRTTVVATDAVPVIVDLGADTGTVVATRTGSGLAIDIELVRAVDLQLEVEAAEGEILLTGMVDSASSPSEAALENGRLTVRARGPGTQRIEAFVTGEESRVRLQTTVDGMKGADRWIE